MNVPPTYMPEILFTRSNYAPCGHVNYFSRYVPIRAVPVYTYSIDIGVLTVDNSSIVVEAMFSTLSLKLQCATWTRTLISVL